MTRSILGALIISAFVACGGNNNQPKCGDGVVDPGEQCDDGNVSNGDGCSSACKTEAPDHCGDGIIDVATEDCDDGNKIDGDGCSSTCHGECGNGMLDTGEACDDGNKASNDGCSAQCKIENGFTCTGEPSHCSAPTGTCTDSFIVAMVDNNGTLEGAGSGDTTNATDQVHGADCDGIPDDGTGHDHIWQFTIPDRRDVSIVIGTSTPFDAVLRVMAAPCDQTTEIAEHLDLDGCSDSGIEMDGESLTYTGMPAGTYYVVIDGYDTTQMGTYAFTVTAAPSACGNGVLDGVEACDDGNTMTSDGCNAGCDVEHGYDCGTAMPSVCVSACGNGHLDVGEECDDGHTVDGDRCSATCTLEYDVLEADDVANNTVPQVITASNHVIKGSLVANDVDLYSFTLTAPATVEIETYDSIDLDATYEGVGNPLLDCNTDDTELRVFDSTGDLTMDATAKWYDDEDGQYSCSYIGPNDSGGVTTQGVLMPGTYTIKVDGYLGSAFTRYMLDFKVTTTGPVPPLAGDLVLNEYMAADNVSDTNCDGSTTGTRDEFVELVNVSNKQLDLTGVTISDTVTLRHTFAPAATGSMTLAPGKAVVVWGGGTPNCPGVTDWFVAKVSPTSTNDQLGLNDAGDTITIKNAAGDILVNRVYPSATVNISDNLSPDVSGTTYVHHNMVNGAVGAFSPGKRANGTAF